MDAHYLPYGKHSSLLKSSGDKLIRVKALEGNSLTKSKGRRCTFILLNRDIDDCYENLLLVVKLIVKYLLSYFFPYITLNGTAKTSDTELLRLNTLIVTKIVLLTPKLLVKSTKFLFCWCGLNLLYP